MRNSARISPTALSLLGPTDSPVVVSRNADGPGPGVILCDHASNLVPAALGDLGLPPCAFENHIAYDIGARGIAKVVSDRLGMPALFGGYSRLVIDLNRPEDDFTSVREIYDGAVIPGNRDLSEIDIRQRANEILHPYHDTVAATIADKVAQFGHPAIISVHTCTDEYLGEHRPWHIGVLSNRDRRMAERVLQRFAAHRPDLLIGDNKPYSGLDAYGYTVETHAFPSGHPNVLFEVRQNLVTTAVGQSEFGNLLSQILSEVLADPSIFTQFQG